jgi:lysophospholipase L1-like esterase
MIGLLVAALAGTGFAAVSGCGDSPTQPGPVVNPIDPTPPSPPTPPPPPPSPPRLGVKRILAFGDSMTEGTTSAPLPTWHFRLDAGRTESYPFKLQALVRERYTDQTIEVLNGGRAGSRASEDRDRFSKAVSEAQPDVILLLEGANDLNAPFGENEGVNDRIRFAVGSLEDLVKDATYRQIPIFVATLPPQRPGGPKAGAADFLTRFNDAVQVMANAKGGHPVDVFAAFPLSGIGQDGLHPTDAGYQRLAEIWLDALKARYETPAASTTALSAAAKQAHALTVSRSLQTPSFGPGDRRVVPRVHGD